MLTRAAIKAIFASTAAARAGRALGRVNPARAFRALGRSRKYRRTITGLDIGGSLAATGIFAGLEAQRIAKANRERDQAVQRFKESLVVPRVPARRKKVPRTRGS